MSVAPTADLLTTAQAADLLGVRTQTVINHVNAGRLVPVTKLPTSTGTYLFNPTDVEALLSPEPETSAS